jgi:hypothetical protein
MVGDLARNLAVRLTQAERVMKDDDSGPWALSVWNLQ